MKSKISAWVLLLVALLATGCSKQKTWAEVYAVKGNVVSYTDTTWTASEKFGEVYRERMTGYTKTELNKHGQLVSQTSFDENGHIERKWCKRGRINMPFPASYTITQMGKFH